MKGVMSEQNASCISQDDESFVKKQTMQNKKEPCHRKLFEDDVELRLPFFTAAPSQDEVPFFNQPSKEEPSKDGKPFFKTASLPNFVESRNVSERKSSSLENLKFYSSKRILKSQKKFSEKKSSRRSEKKSSSSQKKSFLLKRNSSKKQNSSKNATILKARSMADLPNSSVNNKNSINRQSRSLEELNKKSIIKSNSKKSFLQTISRRKSQQQSSTIHESQSLLDFNQQKVEMNNRSCQSLLDLKTTKSYKKSDTGGSIRKLKTICESLKQKESQQDLAIKDLRISTTKNDPNRLVPGYLSPEMEAKVILKMKKTAQKLLEEEEWLQCNKIFLQILDCQLTNCHKKEAANTYYFIAITCLKMNKIDAALKNFKNLVDLMHLKEPCQDLGAAFYHMGIIFANKGDLESGLYYLYKCKQVEIDLYGKPRDETIQMITRVEADNDSRSLC